jgi:NAD(P)-dependent dehydrogenase (short-subunit alcohol dehydrogenase family)
MDLGLKGKNVLITGASRGIGRAISIAFAHEKANLIICARNKDRLDKLKVALEDIEDIDVLAITADLTRLEDINMLAKESIKKFNNIDVLINNVGGAELYRKFEEISDNEWQETFNLNFFSAVRLTKLVIPAMKKNRWGRIVNIASESGVQPDPFMPDYNASKAALINFTKSLSKAYGHYNILINSVSPALTNTELVEEIFEKEAKIKKTTTDKIVTEFLMNVRPNIVLNRPAMPEEIASVVLFLASEKASFITGANIRVDGGSVSSV